MIIKNGMIGLIVSFSLAAGILLERYTTRKQEIIDTQTKYINHQDSLIDQTRAERDSLRITRTEFDKVVKLINEKK